MNEDIKKVINFLYEDIKMKCRKGIFLVAFLFSILNHAAAQIVCDCEPVSEVNICYISRNGYCNPSLFNNCGITLDHSLQSEGLVKKLTNQENFGLNGVVDCPINITSIPEINEIDDILNRNCNVL